MKVSLLIVEDDLDAREIMHTLIALKMPELEIFLAENGAKGLATCRDHAPDIVITDINMPDMDGVRMVEQIWALRRETRFIILTGYTDRMGEFGDIPLHGYLVKPADFKKLLEALHRAIGELEAGTR
jgi:YesN/AraC family two-component response regulator